jgi:hypothetical protein
MAAPIAVSASLWTHQVPRAQPAQATPVVAPEPARMPAAPQTGWRPAALARGLELQFAPASALRHSPFIHT